MNWNVKRSNVICQPPYEFLHVLADKDYFYCLYFIVYKATLLPKKLVFIEICRETEVWPDKSRDVENTLDDSG